MSQDKLLNGFNNGRDKTEGTGGKSFEELNGMSQEIKLHKSWKKVKRKFLFSETPNQIYNYGASDFQRCAIVVLDNEESSAYEQEKSKYAEGFVRGLQIAIETIKHLQYEPRN